ncbi:probable glutathione S-transferase 6 [Aplysia californica]|uniref:Probable glutathione S-transferase 6 n=1 Tax=Aplysia californica TaxID=6500 RepID=A0ABM1ADN0_APLCA|nr:probable glutathione S-transferase 6 [Aplysia californica]
MPSYKLTYFDTHGRAEITRLIFAAAGQSYEDVRIKREDWPKIKATTPFGQVPILEVDGKTFGESVAIATYVAREFGFYGKNNLEQLAIDQVVQLVQDFISGIVKVVREPDPAKKGELLKEFCAEDAPKYFAMFERLLKDNGTGYFVGSSLTLADLALFDFATGLNNMSPGVLDKAPGVAALCQKVLTNEKIKAYVDTRKPLSI